MPQNEPAQTRAERRWSAAAQADRDRRKVRTTSGRPRSTRPITVQVGGRKRRRGRSRRRPGVGTALWGIVTAVVSLVALLTQSLVAIISALTLLGVTVAVARIEARTARAAAPPPPRKIARSRETAAAARKRGSSGTAGRKRPSSGGKTPVCSEACQVSKRPKSTCRCKAPDCKHGSKAGVAS